MIKIIIYQLSMKKLATLSLAVTAVLLLSVSCKKTCTLDDDHTASGIVITHSPTNAEGLLVIYPSSGFLTDVMNGNYAIDGNHLYANYFEVSWDGGITKAPINYSLYTLLANPVVVKCNARINRDVVVDDINNVVTYTITVKECDEGCDELRSF